MEKGTHYREMLPCICSECAGAAAPFYFKYELLKKQQAKKRVTVDCETSMLDVRVDELLEGYAPPAWGKMLKDEILKALSRQQDSGNINLEDEDSRTGYLGKLLESAGYIVKDQTRQGVSATGRSQGRIDLRIENPVEQQVAILEAFILKSKDTKYITTHVQKLWSYDPVGLKDNFMVVYSEAANFSALWEKYLALLPK
ncbi:MAG: hypothetical protein GY765_17940, partial [bacterium]|nr:hypothetical protein [bacterium]